MAEYFKLYTGLSRRDCSSKMEYFCLDVTGLCSVHEYADGFLYMSPVPSKELRAKYPSAEIVVPRGAVPCSAAEYAAVHARYAAAEAKRKAEEDALKALRKGMTRGAHAAQEAGATDTAALELLQPARHFLDDFTVFDTETTGLSPEKNRILEVAAVRYQNWQEVARMQEFVRFSGPVPYFITNLTGITTDHVRAAADSKTVLGKFRKLAGDSLLVGHNVDFDLKMIEAERARLGAPSKLPNRSLCTYQVAKRRTKAPHKLGALCERFGIPVVGAHRALNDVLMTYQLLQHLHQAEPLIPELVYPQPSLFAAA